jgi:hypothetical protein
MVHQPMGAGTVGLRPDPRKQEKKAAQVEAMYLNTLHTAGVIENDLLQSPVLLLIYKRLLGKIIEFTKEDAGCQEDIGILTQLRQGIEWGPAAAEDMVKRFMGPALRDVLSRTQTAP